MDDMFWLSVRKTGEYAYDCCEREESHEREDEPSEG